MRGAAEAVGVPATRELRDRLTDGYLVIGEMQEEVGTDSRYEATHGRYLSLVAVINGSPSESRVCFDVDLGELGGWIAAALRASATATP